MYNSLSKTIFIIGIIMIFTFQIAYTQEKETCEVKLSTINKQYKGDCKKGLASGEGEASGTDKYKGKFKKGLPHGTGTYYWKTGEFYVGKWKKGKRHGEGKYYFKHEGKDTISDGVWKKDIFKGPKKIRPYKISKSRSIDLHSMYNSNPNGSSVTIDFKQNGMRNTSISGLSITASSGTETGGHKVKFESINFPFHCTIKYRTRNKLRTASHKSFFEFTINEPGSWVVVLKN